ncbi:glycoside hydrolase family 128 protein [Annulohypoxylon maeteangense]|uniref:glycoside hydrolase family 128 protein n=1 Tax=Annulohypoxylon maeteangense TaxID=1927788 RepID=UPI0020077A04|nr:glycoside hydrolase family 128 protein [Annulohypoxylon maeteangense]KAI0880602.1 glycoside hydrolase family 128 protein [Annulohypoxylon maeteangense]
MQLSYVVLAAVASLAVAQTRSSKRGLVFVPNPNSPQDNKIWVQSGSDLTWYYNYGSTPSPAFDDVSQDEFEFVPMLWGAINDTSFLDSVQGQMDSGRHITHVLGFNEPDTQYYGGSNIQPSEAADVWVKNIAPLADRGVKLGLPACTGGWGGIPWLQQFLGNCSELISTGDDKKNCTYDFVAIHWYGNFEGLASHMGSYAAAFPNVTQWITEYNFNDQDLATTQAFYNTSSEYFDRMDSVGRYSLFGSFRSGDSNVGPNAVMLNNDGDLTDIGSWYLGITGTGVEPQSGSRRGYAPMVGAIIFSMVLGAFLTI